MNESQLHEILSKGECDIVEFKVSFPRNANDIAKELVAFANTKGGTLLIGVDDTGSIIGLIDKPDATIQRIAGLCRDICKPPLNPQMGQLTIDNCSIVWVIVDKEIKPRSSEDKYYIRVGTTVRVASSDELGRMYTNDEFGSDFRDRINSLFKDFKAENEIERQKANDRSDSHLDGEQRRISAYQENQGLFLIHVWKPSKTPGQVADISIMLCQHGYGPLNRDEVKSVEYYLGPKFSAVPFVKTSSHDDFRLFISAYGPMLCLAKVNFKNNTPPLYLERYCDFYRF